MNDEPKDPIFRPQGVSDHFGLAATVGCDQVTKTVVRSSLPRTGPLSFLHGSVWLEFTRNQGAFLSWGANLPSDVRFWFFNVACAAFLAVLAYVLFTMKQRRPLALIGLTLVLAGGIGNLIDRIVFGNVTDFLFIHIGPVHTGIFNIADVAIVAGILLWILSRRMQLR